MNDTETLKEGELDSLLSSLSRVKDEMSRVIVGQDRVIEQLQIGLLSGGHCLLEGVPGLAKTMMVHALADCMHLDFKRVQFTPDMMPSDLVGSEILQQDIDNSRNFEFKPGPVFTQVLLADEINRTPPKTQAALLEAMQERSVSFGGNTHALPKPFFVLATQNPLEQAGTYPLPEAQLDRFLMLVKVDYPSASEEIDILKRTTTNAKAEPERLLSAEQLLLLQRLTRDVEISDALIAYTARVVRATREKNSHIGAVRDYVRWGAGPRAGQSLILAAKASALLNGRFSVVETDLTDAAVPVLRHRILLNFHAQAESITTDEVVKAVINAVDRPRSAIN